MTSSFPAALDNFAINHQNNVNEPVDADDINDIADAINKIEIELGTNFSGQKFGVFNVQGKPYNAVGNGVNDDTAEIQAAIDDCVSEGRGIVWFPMPLSFYKTSAPLTYAGGAGGESIWFLGAGQRLCSIRNAATDLFTLGGASSNVGQMRMSGLDLQSLSGGGHIFNTAFGGGWGLGQCVFSDLSIWQNNAAKNIYRQTAGVMIDVTWKESYLAHVIGATVPAFYMVGAALFNCNRWEKLRCQNSGEFFFHLESPSSSAWNADNVFRDLTMEVTRGGNIKLLGCNGTIIEHVNTYDLESSGATTRDLIYLGAQAGGVNTNNTSIHQCNRYNGVLGSGLHDIKLAGSVLTEIVKCSSIDGSLYSIDCGNQPQTRIRDYNAAYGIVNPSSTTVIEGWPSSNTIASAATITLPREGNGSGGVFHISGTTTITNITASWEHRVVTLIMDSTAQITDGGNIKLASNFTGIAGRVITLACDGTNWYESGARVAT